MIAHNKPTVGENEKKAVTRVIDSGWLVQGEKVIAFENEMCGYLGLSQGHAVALSSGTASLFIALKALGIRRNDEVIIPTYTCSAVLNAVYQAGAQPLLFDIDRIDFNISINEIKRKITSKTKAVIVTHTFGVPFDVRRLKKLGILLIEDCATALGSRIGSSRVGTFGDCSVFSFYASKVITTGQGGMFVSKNKKFVLKAREYRNFDCVKSYYPRFNFQMTDMQAAMGLVQLRRLPKFLKARKEIAGYYQRICFLKGWDYQKPLVEELYQNWFRFVLKIDSKTAKKLKIHSAKKGIATIVPIERWELLHNYLQLNSKRFPTAELTSCTTLSLPIYPEVLFSGAIKRIEKALGEF